MCPLNKSVKRRSCKAKLVDSINYRATIVVGIYPTPLGLPCQKFIPASLNVILNRQPTYKVCKVTHGGLHYARLLASKFGVCLDRAMI